MARQTIVDPPSRPHGARAGARSIAMAAKNTANARVIYGIWGSTLIINSTLIIICEPFAFVSFNSSQCGRISLVEHHAQETLTIDPCF